MSVRRPFSRREPIQLATATDLRFLPHCATLLRSAISAQRRAVHAHVILAEGVSNRQQEKLRGLVADLGGELSLHWLPRERLSGLAERGSPASWYRPYLPELLPELERVIYLDADAIVVDSLEPLWETKLEHDLLASAGDDLGVLVLDLGRLRKAGSNAEAGDRPLALEPSSTAAVVHVRGPEAAKPWGPGAEPWISEHYWRHRDQTPWPAERAGELVGEIHADPGHPREEFFEPWREARRQRYAGAESRPRKRRALVTMVHDESVLLPIWLRYYSRFFAAEDIYVLDNDTTDGSTDGPGFVRVPASSDRVDHVWMVETLAAFQHELIERYDAVLVTDVDEILAPDPRWGDLGAYIDRLDEEFVNALGYEILHLPDREPELDPGRPILAQRAYWFANDAYDKPLLATVPMEWVPGFHSSLDGRHNEDPDLRLIHLHRMDYEICRYRHARRATRAWNSRDRERRWAEYNRITEGDRFRAWFHTDSGFRSEGIEIVLERIPEHWRDVV